MNLNKRQLILIISLSALLTLRVLTNLPLEKPQNTIEFEANRTTFAPLRDYLSQKTENLLPQPQSALLTGMVLGVQKTLPKDFKKALQNTSTIHIVVVSGQNLTLVSGFVMSLVNFLGRKKTILLSLFIIVFYSLLTGLQVPVLRAALMVGMGSLAQLFNREGSSGLLLLLAASLLLIYNPNWLLSVSFQLSFLATVGVLVVSPQILKKLNFLPEIIKQDLAVSLSAQVLTVPIIAINFHQLSLSGILVNSLILWTVSPIMITGILAIAAALLNQALGQIVSIIPGILLTFFVYIVEFFNQWGKVEVGDYNLILWLGYYLVLLGIYLFLRKHNLKILSQA